MFFFSESQNNSSPSGANTSATDYSFSQSYNSLCSVVSDRYIFFTPWILDIVFYGLCLTLLADDVIVTLYTNGILGEAESENISNLNFLERYGFILVLILPVFFAIEPSIAMITWNSVLIMICLLNAIQTTYGGILDYSIIKASSGVNIGRISYLFVFKTIFSCTLGLLNIRIYSIQGSGGNAWLNLGGVSFYRAFIYLVYFIDAVLTLLGEQRQVISAEVLVHFTTTIYLFFSYSYFYISYYDFSGLKYNFEGWEEVLETVPNEELCLSTTLYSVNQSSNKSLNSTFSTPIFGFKGLAHLFLSFIFSNVVVAYIYLNNDTTLNIPNYGYILLFSFVLLPLITILSYLLFDLIQTNFSTPTSYLSTLSYSEFLPTFLTFYLNIQISSCLVLLIIFFSALHLEDVSPIATYTIVPVVAFVFIHSLYYAFVYDHWGYFSIMLYSYIFFRATVSFTKIINKKFMANSVSYDFLPYTRYLATTINSYMLLGLELTLGGLLFTYNLGPKNGKSLLYYMAITDIFFTFFHQYFFRTYNENIYLLFVFSFFENITSVQIITYINFFMIYMSNTVSSRLNFILSLCGSVLWDAYMGPVFNHKFDGLGGVSQYRDMCRSWAELNVYNLFTNILLLVFTIFFGSMLFDTSDPSSKVHINKINDPVVLAAMEKDFIFSIYS